MSNFLAELTGEPTGPNPKPLPKDQRDDGALFQGTKGEATAYADYYTQQRETDFRTMVYEATHPPAWEDRNKTPWDSIGGWLQTNPAIAYAMAVNKEILAPVPQPDGAPDKPPDWGARVMAGIVTWGAGSEMTYHTPIGGYTGAQVVSKGMQMRAETEQIKTGAWGAMFGSLLGEQMLQGAETRMQEHAKDFTLAAQYTNPSYWGMNKQQAAEFAMAPRGYVGWEEPWFNNMMLPNSDAGTPVTNQADIIRYQAEWILNREDDVAKIAGQAQFFSDIATGDIDYNGNPIVTQLLGELGFPTPDQQAGHRVRIPTRGYNYTEIAYGGDQYTRAGEYDNALMQEQAYRQRVGTAEEPHNYEFDNQTTQALIQSGFSQELISSFSDPAKYADLYGTPDFFAVVAGVRTIDAQKRNMGLNQLQDQSIPLLNQMAFDVALGTDTIIGLLGDTLGISGKIARRATQLGILTEATAATPEIINARRAAGVVGDALQGPITAQEAAARMAASTGAENLPSSWRFANDMVNNIASAAGKVKNIASSAFGVGMAAFGAYNLWTQGTGDDRSMGPADRATAIAAGTAFAAMGVGGAVGMTAKGVGSIAEWISPPDANALPNPTASTVPALANAEANRTFNNLNILWNKSANEETAGYRNFIHSSAQAWDSILQDTRPKYIVDIETTLRSGDIFQIAMRPLGGSDDDVIELLIKPPTAGGGSLEESKDAYQRAMQSGMSLTDAMAIINKELGASSMLIGQNIAGFDLPQLIKAGLTGDHLAVDTLAMAHQAGVSAPVAGQAQGSFKLGDLFQMFTGQPLTGAHDARNDIRATETIFERLIPMVSENLARELQRVDSLDLPDRTLAELNTRALPSTVNEMMRRRHATYRTGDQIDAVRGAFPGMSEAEIIDRVQRGQFNTYEQYLSIYGNADGAAGLEAITKQETDFFRQYGMEFEDAQRVYDYRAKQSIQNRIRIAAPNYSQSEINASYDYLLSQYPGYDPSFVERALPALPSKRDSSSAPFWADLLSHSNYVEGQASSVTRPSVAAVTPTGFIKSLMGLQPNASVTPEDLTDLIFVASGVTDRAIEIKDASETQRRNFVAWLQQNPEADIRQGFTSSEWETYGETPVRDLPDYMASRLLGERNLTTFNQELEQRVNNSNRDAIADGRPQDVKEFVPYTSLEQAINAESGRIYDNHGGDVSVPLAQQLRRPGPAAMPNTEQGILRALRSSMAVDFAANMFGRGSQAIDALDTALNIADENNIDLPETTRWAYETSAELLRTSTEESTQMLRIPLDPTDPNYTSDILTNLLALNEMGAQTGMRVDLRGMRNKPVVDPSTGQASYMLEVPVSEVSEWNPQYSYRNRPEDLTSASLAIELAQQEQAMGTASRQLGLSTVQDVLGASGQPVGKPQHPYAGYTNQQRRAAAITDTEHGITEVLLKISTGQGDRGLTGGYRNLRVASGQSPTTWNELAAAYAQNRIVENIGPSATFDTTQNYGLVMDTGRYIMNAAENAGMNITIENGQVKITGAQQAATDFDPNGAPVSILYQLFEDRVNNTLQLGAASQSAGNPFVVDQNRLAPGMQVTTILNGKQKTGTIVGRLSDGRYKIDYPQAAANEYPDAPYSSGVNFLDGRYDGHPTTILTRNVRPEEIIDTFTTGAASLNIPLQRAANIAEKISDTDTADRTLDYQAEEFLFRLFSTNEAGRPMVAKNINDYAPEVLRRADQMMEETREPFNGGSTGINYYIDWESARGNQITVRPGAPEIVNGRVDPNATSQLRSASYMMNRELAATWELPPSSTIMQQRDILTSLIEAVDSGTNTGRTEPLYSPRQAQTAFLQLQEVAKEQGLAVIFKGVVDNSIEYGLRPRRPTDVLANPNFLGQQAGLFAGAAQRQIETANSLIRKAGEQISAWTARQSEDTSYADALAPRQFEGAMPEIDPVALITARNTVNTIQSIIQKRAAAGMENTEQWISDFTRRRNAAQSNSPLPQPATINADQQMREAIDIRNYNNLPLDPDMIDFLAREAAAKAARAELAQKIASRQALDPTELSQAQDMGLLEGKVFLRLQDYNAQITANGVIVGDQGLAAGDQVVNNDPQNTQFTKNWIENAGLRFYTDVNEAMGLTDANEVSVTNEKVTYRDPDGNIIRAPKKPSEFPPTAPKRDPYTQEEILTLEQSIAQWEQQTAAFNEWRRTIAEIHDAIGTNDTSKGTVTYEGEPLRRQHITATGYVPESRMPGTELEEIIVAQWGDLDMYPGEAMLEPIEAAWLKSPEEIYNGASNEAGDNYNFSLPYGQTMQNRTSITTAEELQSQRARKTFPVLVLDANVARQTVEAKNLVWPEGELPDSFVAGFTPERAEDIRNGLISPINVHFATEGENAPFIAGPAPDLTKMYGAPESLRNLQKQDQDGEAAHRADIATTFFEAIQQPQYWVRNQNGEWVQATRKIRVASGAIFDPANPDATPQYANDLQIWRTTPPGQSQGPRVEMGFWHGGMTETPASMQGGALVPGAERQAPIFAKGIDLIEWYNHTMAIAQGDFNEKDMARADALRQQVIDQGATPVSDIQLLLKHARQELDDANQSGEWSIRAHNIPASYKGPIPTIEDMRALTYGGGEIKTLSQKLTEREKISRATQQAGEMMSLLDPEFFEKNAAESPEMIALAEQDAINATVQMTADQAGILPSLVEQANGLVGQQMLHNGELVTVQSVVPPQSYSAALERTNIPTWMGKQNTVISGSSNARGAPMNMSVNDTSAVSVNVRGADGREYTVSTNQLQSTDIGEPTPNTIPNTPINQMRKYNSNVMGQMDELVDGAFLEFQQSATNIVSNFGAALRALIDPNNAPDPTQTATPAATAPMASTLTASVPAAATPQQAAAGGSGAGAPPPPVTPPPAPDVPPNGTSTPPSTPQASTPATGPATHPTAQPMASSLTAPASATVTPATATTAGSTPPRVNAPTVAARAAQRAANSGNAEPPTDTTFAVIRQGDARPRFAIMGDEVEDPITGERTQYAWSRPTPEELASANPPIQMRPGQKPPWDLIPVKPEEILMQKHPGEKWDTTMTEITQEAMGNPFRPTGLAAINQSLNPFVHTLTSQAVNFRDVMDPIGSLITSATDDPDNYVTIMRALAQDPTSLITGIPGSMLRGMEDQLDSSGMFHLGPGIADKNLRSVMPILEAGSDTLFAMADYMQMRTDRAQADGRTYGPNEWKSDYNEGMLQMGISAYGANQRAVTTELAQRAAGIQRGLLAEAILNLNLGTWIGNFLGGNLTAMADGANMDGSVAEAGARATSKYNLPGGLERQQGSVAGQTEIGTAGAVGLSQTSYYTAHKWANELTGYPQANERGELTGYTDTGILRFLSTENKTKIQDFARWIDKSIPGSKMVMDDAGQPKLDAAGNYIYSNPLADASHAGAGQWTTNKEVAGMAFGEGAMYSRIFNNAEIDFYAAAAPGAYAPLFDRMMADTSLGLSTQTITEMKTLAVTHTADTSRADMATQLLDIAAQDGPMPARSPLRNYVSEILGVNDSLTVRALANAKDTASKTLLEPTSMTNIDSWLGNVFAFSYFGTRTAINWVEKTMRNPFAFGLVANFANAARIEDERNAGTPARYKQSLAMWEGGPEMPNLIAAATGIVRMMGNQYAQQEWEEAETPVDYLKAAASFVGLNPLPLYALLMGEDPAEVAQGVVPQGRNLYNAAMAAGTPVGTNNEYNRYRAARWIGAQATAGVFDESLALMAQQYLYDKQWDTGENRDFPAEAKQIVNSAFIAVGQEALFTSAANSITGFGIKPPPNQNEVYAGAMSENLQTIRTVDGRIANTVSDMIVGIEAWYARGSIYPDQPEGQPMYQPLERMNMWVPQIPRIEPPDGWRLPAWDTVTGKKMTANKNESTFYNADTANTAIYFLFDPRTGEPFYVGQSNQPSNRYLQHIEDVNAPTNGGTDDAFSHPKKLQTAQMIQQGVYPEMNTIGWYAGNPDSPDDDADKQEQAWIGYFYYKLGKTANITVPSYEDWQAILVEKGITIEDLDAEFEKAKQGALPQQEVVQLASTPDIKDSPFYGPVPEGALGNKANLWYPDQETWDWANAAQNKASARPIRGEDWAANQWGLEGVGDKKQKQLWEAGFMSWEDIANASPQEKEALLNIGTEAQVDSWMAKAQYTVGAQRGMFDVQPNPPTQEQLNDEYPSVAETLSGIGNITPVSAVVQSAAATATASTATSSYSLYQPQIDEAASKSPTSSRTTRPLTRSEWQSEQLAEANAAKQRETWGMGGPAWFDSPASPVKTGSNIIQSMLPATPAEEPARTYRNEEEMRREVAMRNVSAATAEISTNVATASQNFFAMLTEQTANFTVPAAGTGAAPTTPPGPTQTDAIQTLLTSARQSVAANGPFDLGAAINTLGMGLANALAGSTRGQASGLVGRMGANWLVPAAVIAGNLAAGNFTVGTQSSGIPVGGGGPVRRRGVPEEAPKIPQVSQYMYLPGYRPSAQPGQQFWLPQLPNGQQFWVGANMVASGDEYRDADWLNNPQYDPNNPEGSLRRMEEVYGPLQPVPLQLLRGQGAFIGDGDRTSYMQPRTILTGARALGANPYGVGGEAGMMQTQGAPDPRTQPELYAKWQEEVMKPRGEYGIWMESPLGKAPNFDFEQTGTGLTWKTKERTPVTVTAPGMVIAVEDTPLYGKIVIVQHDFGQTIYSGLSGTGLTPGTYLATGDLVGLSGKDFSLGMQIAGQEGYVNPAPYMPSTGERGASGWALTDIPGVSAAEAALLVDMGFRTPEDLKERGTAAGIDQHPVFGGEFDAREGWSIMSAVNALLDSGDNPNPPKESTEVWSTAIYAAEDGTEITGAATVTNRATKGATSGATAPAGNVTADAPAGTQEPGEFPLTAGMVPHLTEGRITNLIKNAPHLASVSALAALDPDDPAQTKALAKALGNSADAADAAEIIAEIARFKTPSANANIGNHPYLFATDMRGPFTGTNITASELQDIATKGKARTFGELAATNPAKLAADAGISLQQAKNAIAVASRYAPDAEPNSRTTPKGYTDMPAPPESGPQLTEDMFAGLTQSRIDALAAAGITTLGQLTMIGKPPTSLEEGGPRVNWTPDWVRVNSDGAINNNDVRMLAERGEEYAANIATEGPRPGATPLTANLFKSLTANNVAELKKANITTLEQLQQINQPNADGNVQWSSQWVATQSGNDITPARVEVLAKNANAYTAPDPLSSQTSIMSQRGELGLEFKEALRMANQGIYDLGDLARTDTHWLRDNVSGINVDEAFKAVTTARTMAGMRMATPEEEKLRRERNLNLPNLIYGTDPARTETRYPFRYEQPGTGIKGINAQQEAYLYGMAPTRELKGSGNVIDTAAEFADADPDWIYEASNFKWSMESINTAQNLLRDRLGQATQTLGDSRYAAAAQQDLTTLGLTEEQVEKLKKLGIYDYGRLISSEHSNATIASALGYNEDKVATLRESAATQMKAIKAKLDAEQKGEPESAQPSTPLAKQLTEPTDATAKVPDFKQIAVFLGMSEEEAAALTETQRTTMVNDRLSLYNQRQTGSGESDNRTEKFAQTAQIAQRYDMGSANIDAVAERTANVTDRRGTITLNSPMPSRGTPPISNRTAGIDMKQVANMVRSMIGDLEPKLASNFYRQLERSLYT